MSHQALHTLRQAVNGDDTAKKIANTMRLLYFLERYVRGEPYIQCLVPTDDAHKIMLRTKTSEYLGDVYFFAYEILRTSLEGYAHGNYKFLVDEEKKKWLDDYMEEGVLKMLHLNF